MIVIDKILISDDVIEEQFVCDLHKCKGGCCEDGDAGAPLAHEELDRIADVFEKVKPLLTKEGLDEINRKGLYRYDRDFGWVTPTVNGKICAYGFRDNSGIIRCAFEEAKNRGLTTWKKPVSCHLYPIKIKASRYNEHTYMNYEPRESLCSPGCALGSQLKMPVYKFLKEALVRTYGEKFYHTLEQIAENNYSTSDQLND